MCASHVMKHCPMMEHIMFAASLPSEVASDCYWDPKRLVANTIEAIFIKGKNISNYMYL